MQQESAWSDERITQLRALWTEGLSTAEIGRRLGISKNAVVGKAHRLHLPARPSPIRNPPAFRPAQRRPMAPAPQPHVMRAPEPQAAPAKPEPAKVIARINYKGPTCQWPIGHPGQSGFHFCGDPSAPGRPYCSTHAARAYVGGKSSSSSSNPKDEQAA